MQATSARRTMSSEAAHDRPCSSAWLAERPTKQLQWCGRSAMLRAHRRPSEPSPPVTRASAALQPLWATTAFSPARATDALLRAAHGARIIA
eukprot:scaffold3313_cov250-Prasinococcus_capsulatus_cf.AAC.1